MKLLNDIKENRTLSFIIVTIVYIIATVVGVGVYQKLSYDWWLNLLIADVVATVVTFIFSLIFRNASVYAFLNPSVWNWGSVVFFLLSVAAATIQGIADIQMHRFRKKRTGSFICCFRIPRIMVSLHWCICQYHAISYCQHTNGR